MPETLTFSFEKTYQSAYSHGLEAIYALETVDPKSIRTLGKPAKKSEELAPSHLTVDHPFDETFDLGCGFREWIPSFVPLEPISVIGISKYAEKCLHDNCQFTLSDLIDKDLSSFIYFKGMGQGHLDEISYRLKKYLQGKEVKRATKIDFTSWLRILSAGLDLKKCFVLFERYGLQNILSLSIQEKQEVRRLTLEKKYEWIEEATDSLLEEKKRQAVLDHHQEIIEALFRPWILARGGLATEEELVERLLDVSLEKDLAKNTLSLFQDVFFEKNFFLSPKMTRNGQLIFWDDNILALYDKVVSLADSYFYHPFAIHPLSQLTGWIEKEASLSWIFFPERFIEKALRLSPHFSVKKKRNKGLMISKTIF